MGRAFPLRCRGFVHITCEVYNVDLGIGELTNMSYWEET